MTYGEFAKIYDELILEDIDYAQIEERINQIISLTTQIIRPVRLHLQN